MLTLNFDPFPVITTERLVLRDIRATDAPHYFVLRSDPAIMKYIPRPVAKTVDDASAFITRIHTGFANKENINWAITMKGEDRLIGTIGYVRMKPEHFRAEMGCMLRNDLQGKGIMQEAITAIINFGFDEMKLNSIEALIDPDNKSSEKILKKNKFVQEAFFKENEFYEGKFLDTIVYTLLAKNR